MARKSTKKSTKKKAAKPTVRKDLPRCKRCGGTKLKVLHTSEIPYHGVHDGRRYTSVVRQKVQCLSCKLVQMLVSHPYDPKKWRSDATSTETEKKEIETPW